MRLRKHTPAIIGGGLAVFAAALLVAVPVAAQPSGQPAKIEKITMVPSSVSKTINAGSTADGSLEVINSGDLAFEYRVYPSPYGVTGESYTPDFSGKFPNSDAYKWVELSRTTGRLEPGASAKIAYKLNVPANAAPGGHYGVIFAETKAAPVSGTGVARQKRVGHIMFLTVNGSIQKSGEVAGFSLPFWQKGAPLQSSVRVKNTGNVNLDTKVETIAKDIFGRTKFTYTGDAAVLRETTRLIDMNWEKAPNFGLFRVTQGVKYLGQENLHRGFVLIAPGWFLVLMVLIILGGVGYAVFERRKHRG